MNVNAHSWNADVELMFAFAACPGRVGVRGKRSELQVGTREVATSETQLSAHRSAPVSQASTHHPFWSLEEEKPQGSTGMCPASNQNST